MGEVVGLRAVQAMAERGDYRGAVAAALAIVPCAEAQLRQYEIMMELYEEARVGGSWRRALRALADARMAAIAAELPELETVATARLYEVVRLHELRRA